MRTRLFRSSKVPAVFLLFWVVKLLTTGIGESGADFLGTVSIPLAALVGIGGFLLALRLQLRAPDYSPVRYWITVLTVALFGTMIADGPHVALGTPYYVDSAIYFVLLCGLLAWWKASEGTLSVHSITTARRERFYWGAVLLTFGLGTAVGDTTAVNLGLGFGWSIVLFTGLILVPLVLWRLGLNATLAFWASYVLTRPLGASIADWLGKARSAGGLGWGDGAVTGLGLLLFAALVTYLALSHGGLDDSVAGREHEGPPAHEMDPALD
jgi:uncharacterized membrane-anchored protein